jgi:ADP-L-glycero-D-manno-heptose 6-epimerase
MSGILVTGTSGFVGSRLVERLKSQNKEVIEIDEDYFFTENWMRTLRTFLDSKKPEAIFHVGACSDTLEQDSQYMMIRNYQSTKLIMDWAVTNSSALIYSSSAATYGEEGNYPSNIYGWSKYAAEDYVRLSSGVSLRYFNVYGPGENHKGRMSSFFLQAQRKKNNGEDIRLFPKKPLRDFVYIEDVISANLYALENYQQIKSGVFDVGSCQARSFEDGLEILGINYSYTEEEAIPRGYQFFTSADKSKLIPGWKPAYDLDKGLNEYSKTLGLE